MDDSTKLGLAFAGVAVAAAAAGAVLARRRSPGGGLGGTWSRDVQKLQVGKGETYGGRKAVVVAWSLLPGPPPAGGTPREGLREVCRKAGGKERLYGELSRPRKGMLARIQQEYAPFWGAGTCPGCSRQCARFCYPSKTTMAVSADSQRMAWGNTCDVVEGKRPSTVRFVDCADPGSKGAAACRARGGAAVAAPADLDRFSGDLEVDSARIGTVFARIHVAGDFFDAAYARAWRRNAEQYLRDYYVALRQWQEGHRRNPPPRAYFWTYTRSWRVPDAALLDEIRTLPTLGYEDDRYPAWHEKAGQLFRPGKEIFGLLLSADSDTGVPWIKDKLGRIMPVAFLLTAPDLALVDSTGQPAVVGWDAKIPGPILRDHSLRKLPPSAQKAFDKLLGLFWCLAEVPGEEKGGKRAKKARSGCFSCRRCFPGAAQGAADSLFKRYMLASQRGLPNDAFAEWGRFERAAAAEEYDRWKADPDAPIFQMAVEPADLPPGGKLSEREERQLDWWLQRRAKRLPLVGEKG